MTPEQQIAAVSERILAAQAEREQAEKEANAHEQSARDKRLLMSKLKTELAELSTVLNHAGVAKRQNDAVSAAEKAKAEAEQANASAKEVLARLYECRWGVEVNLRHLKQTMGMDVLRCETLQGVLKEVAMFVVAYNLVRRVMREAARRQRVQPNRISFVDALRWLRESKPGEDLPRLKVNPHRPGRVEPRVKKRRPKKFKLMNKPRKVLRAALLHQSAAAPEDAP